MIKDDIWTKAPEEATHYTPAGVGTNWVYWRIDGGFVTSVWVASDRDLDCVDWYPDQGFSRTDYSKEVQPDTRGTPMIVRPTSTVWTPSIGDRVMYKNTDSLDYAWDKPEEMEVISIHDGMYGLLGGCGYVWSQLHNISPPTMKKTEYEVFEKDMLDILLDGWQTSSSRAKALCEVLYEKGLRFTNTEKSV